MNQAFIFDVDGTLTPSRKPMDPVFKEFITQFAHNHEVYLVTGSDYAKTVEQVGWELVEDVVKVVYNCSGNNIWERGMEIYKSSWTLPDDAEAWLLEALTNSPFTLRTGNHLEVRPGTVNFSIVGRNADDKERAQYVAYDESTGERLQLVKEFNEAFANADVVATVGGQTGLDLTRPGYDKRQILRDFDGRSVQFFGDRCDEGGNDYALAKAIIDRRIIGDRVHMVSDWQDTWERLTSVL